MMRTPLSFYLCTAILSFALTGCGGNQEPLPETAEFRANCQVCHALDGSPTPLGPQNIQLGPNTCQLVDCSDLAALTNYIETYMPPNPQNCVAECAQETAQLIYNNFQPTNESAARMVMESVAEILDNAEVKAYDQTTGDSVSLEASTPEATNPNP